MQSLQWPPVCADLQSALQTRLTIDWRAGVAATDWDTIAKKEHLDQLSVEMRKVGRGGEALGDPGGWLTAQCVCVWVKQLLVRALYVCSGSVAVRMPSAHRRDLALAPCLLLAQPSPDPLCVSSHSHLLTPCVPLTQIQTKFKLG
jgi:hypothetical protein